VGLKMVHLIYTPIKRRTLHCLPSVVFRSWPKGFQGRSAETSKLTIYGTASGDDRTVKRKQPYSLKTRSFQCGYHIFYTFFSCRLMKMNGADSDKARPMAKNLGDALIACYLDTCSIRWNSLERFWIDASGFQLMNKDRKSYVVVALSRSN
jgi:hypothetical protein